MAARESAGALQRFLHLLHRLEDGMLATMLAAMILLACAQIFLRNFLASGIAWADPTLRVMVLWLGLLGALAASRANEHISVDLFTRVLPQKVAPWARVVTSLFTAGVCALIAYHGLRFVLLEFEMETVQLTGVPAWTLASIVPFSFGMISVRYFLLCALAIRELLSLPR